MVSTSCQRCQCGGPVTCSQICECRKEDKGTNIRQGNQSDQRLVSVDRNNGSLEISAMPCRQAHHFTLYLDLDGVLCRYAPIPAGSSKIINPLDIDLNGILGLLGCQFDEFQRIPSLMFSVPVLLRSVSVANSTSPTAKVFLPVTRASNMFIAGAPMKYPTNVVLGRSNSSFGLPICTTRPAVHHHDILGKGHCLILVVRDIDRNKDL